MNDLVIRGGWVIDGTGRPRRRADIGISDGLIVEISSEPHAVEGRREIAADGMIVAPGFIDIHTHYDAQLTWDPATPSLLHGVTSVIGGNCGFSIAPITPESAEYLIPMLATVEGMPEEALSAGLDVTWRSFGEFLDRLEGNLTVNAGFMVGHSALRRTVMGEDAVGALADGAAMAEMVRLAHESIEGGAVGFSSSRGEAHADHNGAPVPSRHAALEEILALCRATGDHPGTSLEVIPTLTQEFDEEAQMLLVAMSLTGRRPVNWNSITLEQDVDARESRLRASDSARAAGGKVVGLAPSEPLYARFALDKPFLWESIPGWSDTMRLPLAARIEAFKQPHVRAGLKAGGLQWQRRFTDWPGYAVNDVQSPHLRALVGKTMEQIARERGCDPFDAFCDVAVEDGLRAGFAMPVAGDDEPGWQTLVELCRDHRVVVGASDAGAHVDHISAFAMGSGFLGEAVRARQLLTFEEAIAMLTSAPARLYGLVGRGTLSVGGFADVVIFDPEAIGHGPTELRADLPGGAERLSCEAQGIREVIVNGTVAVRSGELTGATTGRTIRSGRDTETPALT